ncbi:MAG: hypothetical protein H0T39_08305 [Actinobacteria bacterium]|nr:hypothetical protein [Actinomycetota bacterium]
MSTTSRRMRFPGIALAALVTLAVAGTVAVALPPSAAAAAQWQLQQLDADRCWDSMTLDADFNGIAEQVWFDVDNDCRWDTRQYNTRGGDAFHEELSYDMNENGVPEYLLQDIDQRVGYEWLYIDLNQDRRFEAKRIIPGSSLDRLNRDNNRLLVDMTTQQTLNDIRRWASR